MKGLAGMGMEQLWTAADMEADHFVFRAGVRAAAPARPEDESGTAAQLETAVRAARRLIRVVERGGLSPEADAHARRDLAMLGRRIETLRSRLR